MHKCKNFFNSYPNFLCKIFKRYFSKNN